MIHILIRPLEANDQHAVDQIMAEHPLQFPKFVRSRYPERWSEYLTSNSDSRSGYYIAQADEVLGHAGYVYNDDVGMYEIVGVAVSKNHQRQGIGIQLIKKVCNKMQSLGAHQVILYTLGHTGNEDTLKFYRKIGFRETNYERDFFRPEFHRVTFMKDLL